MADGEALKAGVINVRRIENADIFAIEYDTTAYTYLVGFLCLDQNILIIGDPKWVNWEA